MIHIATVHWGSSLFQEIQFKNIAKNISDFKIWTFLDRIKEKDDKKNRDMYHFHGESGIVNHLSKLDMLSEMIFKEAKEDDVILFMDGDAWPIAPMDEVIKDCLSNYSAGAVVRSENNERHAHPSFCFAKASLWRDLDIKWRGGTIGKNQYNVTYPVAVLRNNNKEWQGFKRTGGLSDHGVFFSIYGEKIYHHGAGFRLPVSAHCRSRGIKVTPEHSMKMFNEFLEKYNKENHDS